MSIKQNQALRERIRHITESKPFSIHRTVFTSDWELALYQHWHPEFEFFYLVKGEVQFQVEAKTLHLHAGEAVFLRPYLLHRAQRMDEHGGIFNAFVFSPTFLSDTISEQHYELYEAENSIITGQNNIILIRDDSNWERAILENLRDIYQCHMLPLHDCELRIRGRFFDHLAGIYKSLFSIYKQSNA